MKKIILALAVLFALGSTTPAAAQQVKFYYYPSSNVYYNPSTTEYWYYDAPTTKWVEARTLPTTITVEKTPRYLVYYNGQEVWKANAEHKKKYKPKNMDKAKKD